MISKCYCRNYSTFIYEGAQWSYAQRIGHLAPKIIIEIKEIGNVI